MKNPNHPKKGADITQDPIMSLSAIRHIRANLKQHARNTCYYLWGINTAFRTSELLSLSCGQVAHLNMGDEFRLKLSKQNKHRIVIINEPVVFSTQRWLREHPDPRPDAPLFMSETTGRALTRETMNKYVKRWCKAAGLQGNYGTHSLRKTWGHMGYKMASHIEPEVRIKFYQECYLHSDPAITRIYIRQQRPSIRGIYLDNPLW